MTTQIKQTICYKLKAFSTFNFQLLIVLMLLAGCSKDEPDDNVPMVFFSTEDTPQAKVWDGEQIAVSINGAVAVPFTAASDGTLTPFVPVYWQTATQSITVKAWHPAEWTMQTDQSAEANYKAADFIFAPTTTIAYADRNTANLTFSHKTAKVTATFTAGTGVTDLSGAAVSFLGFTSGTPNTDNGTITGSGNNWITPFVSGTNERTALLIPQDMTSKQFIRVTLDGGDYYYTPQPGETNLQAGKSYTYSITVDRTTISVVLLQSNEMAWGEQEDTTVLGTVN